MNSDTCPKPDLGTFKSISNPIHSGAGKRTEAYCFKACICLLRMSGSWATLVGSYHWALAKGDEATHSPSSWETKGSRNSWPLGKINAKINYRFFRRFCSRLMTARGSSWHHATYGVC